MLSQRDAVVTTTLEVLKKSGVDFAPEKTSVTEIANKEIRTQVIQSVVDLVRQGKVSLKDTPSNKAKLADDTKLTSYVSSLVSNHWNRDPQLNGGVKRTK